VVIEHETARIDKMTAAVSLGDSVANPMSLKQRALEKFAGLDEAKMEAKIEATVDKSKEFAKKTNEKRSAVEAKSEKTESLEYLSSVRSLGESTFDGFRMNLPAGATDVELVGLINVFSGERHTVDAYVQAISSKLDRFRKSEVTKIGRRNATHFMTDGEVDIPGDDAVRDVKVQWRTYISGYPKDLVFMHQDGFRDGAGFHDDDPDSPEFKKSGPKKFGPHAPLGPVAAGVGPKHDDKFIIAQEFWDVAVERHLAVWKTEPETVVIDDSGPGYEFDPRRQQKAKTQKYNIARAQQAADHAANISLQNQQAMERAKKMGPQTIDADIPDSLRMNGFGEPDSGGSIQ
jgi:hypothetical protein